MIKEIRLGNALRKKVERSRVCDAILAEEARMSAEICENIAEDGYTISSFFDKTGKAALDYEPLAERREILSKMREETPSTGENWLRRYRGALDGRLPVSIEIDVVEDENKHRHIRVRFFDSNENLIEVGSVDIDEYGRSETVELGSQISSFTKTFGLHWFTIKTFDQKQKNQPEGLTKKFDIVRRATHMEGLHIMRAACSKADFWFSSGIDKKLFEFVATLWPHRDNPLPAILAKPYEGYDLRR